MSHKQLPKAVHHALLNAAILAPLARLAYSGDVSHVEPWTHCRTYEQNSSRVLHVWNESQAVLAIAGTNDLADLRQDLKVAPERLTSGGVKYQVHAGFLEHAEQVLVPIGGLEFPRELYIVGHSLGGAVAQILPLLGGRLQPTLVIGYGSPRWLAKEEPWRYALPAWVVRRWWDPWPAVPRVQYCQPGRQVWLDPAGLLTTEGPAWWRIWGRAVRNWSNLAGDAHSVAGYERLLNPATIARQLELGF